MSSYHVDATGGDDGDDGLTEGTAWQTLGKVAGTTLIAGDTVQLKRGEVWRESLTVNQSGAAGNPITFETYGAGARPRVTGCDLLSGWSLVAGNVYQASFNNGITTFTLLEDGTPLQRVTGSAGSPLLDDFNRGNGAVGANYTTGVKGETVGLEVNSNVCKLGTPYGGIGTAYWDVATFAQSLGVAARMSTPVGTWNETELFLGIADPGASADGYELRCYQHGSNGGEFYLYRLDNGTRTQLGATMALAAAAPFAADDSVRVYRSGNDLIVQHKTSAGSWTTMGTRTDSTYTADGYVGLGGENNDFRWDDFGTATAANPTPIVAPGQFWADDANDTIYMWATDDADPDTHTIEIGARYNVVIASDRTYIDFDGIHFHGAGGEFGGALKITAQSADINVSDCEASDSWFAGIWLEHDGTPVIDDVTVTGCEVHHCAIAGVNVNGTDATERITGFTMTGGSVHDNGGNSSAQHGAFIQHTDGAVITGVEVYGNVSSQDWGGGLYLIDSVNATVTENVAHHNTNNGIHLDLNSNGFELHRNVVYDNANGIVLEEHLSSNGTSRMTHNTVYRNVSGIRMGPGSTVFEVSGVTVKNNISAFNTYAAVNIDTSTGGTPTDYDNNTFGTNGYWGDAGAAVFRIDTVARTLAQWQSDMGLDATSLDDDPEFTDIDNDDVTLTLGSPFVNAGEVLAGLNDGYSGAAPDLGAFETVLAFVPSVIVI